MSFDTAERLAPAPIELVTFARAAQVWRYAGAERDQTVGGLAYRAVAMRRTPITRESESRQAQVTLTLPAALPVFTAFRATIPNRAPLVVTLTRVHRADADAEPATIFQGEVASVRFADGVAEVRVESLLAALERPMLPVLIQRQCNWTLGDTNCRVDLVSLGETVTLAALGSDGRTLSISPAVARPAGFYTNGVVVYDGGRYGIEFSDTDLLDPTVHNLRLYDPLPAAAVGQTIAVYPGCARTATDCVNKFANFANYGGFHGVPDRSPFIEGVE